MPTTQSERASTAGAAGRGSISHLLCWGGVGGVPLLSAAPCGCKHTFASVLLFSVRVVLRALLFGCALWGFFLFRCPRPPAVFLFFPPSGRSRQRFPCASVVWHRCAAFADGLQPQGAAAFRCCIEIHPQPLTIRYTLVKWGESGEKLKTKKSCRHSDYNTRVANSKGYNKLLFFLRLFLKTKGVSSILII